MTQETADSLRGEGRSVLELVRLARLAGELNEPALEAIRHVASDWLAGSPLDVTPADTAFLVEALFKCGRLSEASALAKQRLGRGEATTAFDELAQQYQRLASYDFALPPRLEGAPLFPPASGAAPRVLSLYHSAITFQTSGYTVRTQALLANSQLDVVALTRIGYPWAAKLLKSAQAKHGSAFETESAGVRYAHRRGLVTSQSQTFSNLGTSKHEILKAISDVRPHVVHAASNFVNALPALLAAREAGLPFVYEMRGLWELTAGVGIPGWLESERYQLERRIETFVAQQADAVIVLSDVQKRELVERGVEPNRVRVVINGHEPQRAAAGRSPALLAQHCPGLSEWLGGRTVIGYAGAIAVYEGLQDLIASVAEHRNKWTGVAVVIAGDGPYSQQLAAQVASLKLEDRVRLLGRVPEEVADALYSVVDLCILPRRPDLVSQLITPLKTVEILSHGKVLLASNVGAMAEQVGRYGFGETFIAGDRADLGQKLDKILAELPALKKRYAAATAHIADEFSWASIAKQWDELLRDVALGRQQSSAPLARTALAPLYDDHPVRLHEPLPLLRRVARTNLLIEADFGTYLRAPAELEGSVRLLALESDSEIAHEIALGPVRSDGHARYRELRSLPPGRYDVFLYVPLELAASAPPDAFAFAHAPDPWQPDEVTEARATLRRESRQFIACEIQHDAKNPTALDIFSDHPTPVRVAASYIPLTGAELHENFTQRTKSRVTGTRFHYITVTPGSSELALFPRMTGRLLVELTPWGEGEILENRLRRIARVKTVPRDASLFPELDRQRLNVLVAANLNETLLDGSTIWLKTLTSTLARLPDVNVYVATNALHVSNGVTRDMFDKPNVAKIDVVTSSSSRAADLAERVRLLDRTAGGFDAIIVRGGDIAKLLVNRSNRDRIFYYGAGLFARRPDGSVSVDRSAVDVASKCAGVIFQNTLMTRLLREHAPAYSGECLEIVPCVEDATLAEARKTPAIFQARSGEKLVVYAGKLIREYGVLELVDAVRNRIASGRPTHLVLLGNKLDGRDPSYQDELEAAIRELGDAVTWLPAVSPSVALAWALRADAVWGWRHGDFENSHFEISTKMVEAICAGAPIVLYPAAANVALMGGGYSGFGSEALDAAQALERLLSAGRAAFAELSTRLASRFLATEAYRPLLERLAVSGRKRRAPGPAAKPSILIAAHDFRFIEDVEAYWLRDGIEVFREAWKSHTARYVHGGTRAAERADVVLCEWCLGNAVWWSNNLPRGKRLIVRLHLQELQTPHPANVDWSRVERVIFISPHVMREAITKFGIPAHKCQVVPISVRLEPGPPLDSTALERRRNTLGMVGITPWRKRPDLALELFHSLRRRYPDLRLLVKGHTPSSYAWMAQRADELSRYQGFFQELGQLERAGLARLSGYDDALEAFYREVGFILSLSDFEGCHTAVAEGGAMGCLPLMLPWPGASEVYSPELTQGGLPELEGYFDACYTAFEARSRAISGQFQRTFGIDEVYRHWRQLVAPRAPGAEQQSRIATAAV